MKGIQFLLEKVTAQIQSFLIKPNVPLTLDIFQINFAKLSLQALHIADSIIKNLDSGDQLHSSFKKLISKLKQSRKYKPQHDDESEEGSIQDNELTNYLNSRKPVAEPKNLGELEWYLKHREKKEEDTNNFLEQIAKLNKNQPPQKKLPKLENNSTQTEITWVAKLTQHEGSALLTEDFLADIPQFADQIEQHKDRARQLQKRLQETEVRLRQEALKYKKNKMQSQQSEKSEKKVAEVKRISNANTNGSKSKLVKGRKTRESVSIGDKKSLQAKTIKQQKKSVLEVVSQYSQNPLSKDMTSIMDTPKREGAKKAAVELSQLSEGLRHQIDRIEESKENVSRKMQNHSQENREKVEGQGNKDQKLLKQVENQEFSSEIKCRLSQNQEVSQQKIVETDSVKQNQNENRLDQKQQRNSPATEESDKSLGNYVNKQNQLPNHHKLKSIQEIKAQSPTNADSDKAKSPLDVDSDKTQSPTNVDSEKKLHKSKKKTSESEQQISNRLSDNPVNTLDNQSRPDAQDSSQKVLTSSAHNKASQVNAKQWNRKSITQLEKNTTKQLKRASKLSRQPLNPRQPGTPKQTPPSKFHSMHRQSASQELEPRQCPAPKQTWSRQSSHLHLPNVAESGEEAPCGLNRSGSYRNSLPQINQGRDKMVSGIPWEGGLGQRIEEVNAGDDEEVDTNFRHDIERMKELYPADEQDLIKKDALILDKIQQLEKRQKPNPTEIRLYVQMLERMHQRFCGKNCKHLERFYRQMKISNNFSNRVPISMHIRKIGFFS